MHYLRHVITGGCRGRSVLKMLPANQAPIRSIIRMHHDEFAKPFDNLPFSVPNRYVLTAVFCVLFGVGWWAPFAIVWYAMAKRTM